MNLPYGQSPLRRAIERGLANGDLETELEEIDDLKLKSQGDADAVCWGLEQLNETANGNLVKLTYALAGMFQDVENRDCEAFEALRERGIPELVRLFDEIQKTPEEDLANTLLFTLKILALYGTTDGTLKIIEAAQRPLHPDDYMWSVILGCFRPGHPQNELLFGSLKDPLPEGFIGIALLDAANQTILGGEEMPHPFDCAEGRERLKGWLVNNDAEEHSYAHSATAALPFIGAPERDTLLNLALGHADPGVQLEAAWAAAKIGREDGFARLVEFCRDFRTADIARRYLSELERDELVPEETKAPDFAALAEFANWCAHPNELGHPPDDLEIVDHRELRWPPERDPKPFWLLRYRMRDAAGTKQESAECGLVGSITFCFFSYKLAQRPPEDAYAIHCYWEMEQSGLIEETDIQCEAGDYASLLQQWTGPPLGKPRMLFVAELSPKLGCPQRLIGLASVQLGGEAGWVVLDGSRSEWYPRADMPSDTPESLPLKIHVGSHLLGLTGKRDRRKYLASQRS